MEKKYTKTEILVCGECKGEGKIWIRKEPARHGSSDYEIGTFEPCPLCKTSGMVKVKKDTVVTVTPHTPEHG